MAGTVKHAKNPKSFVNVRRVGFAELEQNDESGFQYGDALLTRGVKSVASESSSEVKVNWADGMELESGRNNGERTITLLMAAFGQEVRELLFNQGADEDGVTREQLGDVNNEVAFWFVHERADRSYKLYIYPRCAFNEPNVDAQQEEEGDYEYSEEESEGIAMYRLADETRRFVYDSNNENGSLEKTLRAALGEDYDIEEIAKSIDRDYRPENPGSGDGNPDTP